ncbi:MAG: hypothetical protein ACYDAD_10925 [Acidimicrobiales bacterium]
MRRGLTALAVAIAAFALASCSSGSSSKSSASSGTAGNSTTSSTSSDGSSTSATGAGGSASGFCAQLQKASSDLSTSPLSKVNPSDPNAAKAALDPVITEFKKLADSAPSDIKPDVQAVADAFVSIRSALSGGDPSKVASEIGADTQKLTNSIQRFSSYAVAHCSGT